MGGTAGKKLDQTLRTVDHNTGILSSELRALTTAGAEATTGIHFDAAQVLSENLGSAIGSGLVDKDLISEQPKLKEQPFTLDDELYLTDNVLDMIHPKRTEKAVIQNYIAQQLSGSGGYESSFDYLSSKQAQNLGNYRSLSFDSDLIQSGNNEIDNPGFESKVYWNSKEHGVRQFTNDATESIDVKGFSFEVADLGISSILNETYSIVNLNTEINKEKLAIILMSEVSVGNYAEQVAVGHTVLNRMHRNNTTNVEDVWRAYDRKQQPSQKMIDLADNLLAGKIPDNTGGATHYYSPRSMPQEGDSTRGFDVGGGLEQVHGLLSKSYRPSFADSFKYVIVQDAREEYFKFYLAPGTGKVR